MFSIVKLRGAAVRRGSRYLRDAPHSILKIDSKHSLARTLVTTAVLLKQNAGNGGAGENGDLKSGEGQRISEHAQKFIKDAQANSARVLEDGRLKFRENRRQMTDLSKDIREKTLQRSKDIREKTLQRSKDLKANIKKIMPKDIHENIYTVPNILTFTRIVSAPAVGYLILHGQVTLALALFTYSCITDFLDGFIARRWNLRSVVGSIIDPLADKMLMMVCTVCLATVSEIPLYLATLIIGRDVGLGLAAIVIRYLSLPAPKTFWRYWDFSIPSAEVYPTMISKINTALQMFYLGSMMIKPVFLLYLSDTFGPETTSIFLAFLQYLEWTVATTTLWSGLSYLFSKKAVKFIKH